MIKVVTSPCRPSVATRLRSASFGEAGARGAWSSVNESPAPVSRPMENDFYLIASRTGSAVGEGSTYIGYR